MLNKTRMGIWIMHTCTAMQLPTSKLWENNKMHVFLVDKTRWNQPEIEWMIQKLLFIVISWCLTYCMVLPNKLTSNWFDSEEQTGLHWQFLGFQGSWPKESHLWNTEMKSWDHNTLILSCHLLSDRFTAVSTWDTDERLSMGWMCSVVRSAHADISTVATMRISKALHRDQCTDAPRWPAVNTHNVFFIILQISNAL